MRYTLDGRAREMGLGPIHTVGLADARKKAAAARALLLQGIDPLAARDAEKAAHRKAQAKLKTFREVAEQYIAAHRPSWKNRVHAAQWESTLRDYVYPVIGDLSIASIDTGNVTAILTPIWNTKTVTAARLRGRIEAILDYAKACGWRDGENAARWKGHLDNVFPKPSKVANSEHHAALPWQEIGAFMPQLAAQDGEAALALRFLILNATRTTETIGARWPEIDMQNETWTVPPERMKSGVEHRVPLSTDAIAVLQEAMLRRGYDPNGFVFPGRVPGKPLSNMAMLMLLEHMGRDDLTVHGFRSTFRDWAAETGKPADIAEAALAHVVGDKTVAAYQRSDLLDRRRRLMTDWALWCATPPRQAGANVVALRRT
jgi:integrase